MSLHAIYEGTAKHKTVTYHHLLVEEAPGPHRLLTAYDHYLVEFPWIYYGLTFTDISTLAYLPKARYMRDGAEVCVHIGWAAQQVRNLHSPVVGQVLPNAYGFNPCFRYGSPAGDFCHVLAKALNDNLFRDIYHAWWMQYHQRDGWEGLQACPFVVSIAGMACPDPRTYYRSWEKLPSTLVLQRVKNHIEPYGSVDVGALFVGLPGRRKRLGTRRELNFDEAPERPQRHRGRKVTDM